MAGYDLIGILSVRPDNSGLGNAVRPDTGDKSHEFGVLFHVKGVALERMELVMRYSDDLFLLRGDPRLNGFIRFGNPVLFAQLLFKFPLAFRQFGRVRGRLGLGG